MSQYIQVITTIGHREEALQIAQALVEGRLAACVQVLGPLTSTYRWRGHVETAEEWQCCVKSRQDLYQEIEATIRRLHPYEVPEILEIAVLGGDTSYLAWLERELKPPANAE